MAYYEVLKIDIYLCVTHAMTSSIFYHWEKVKQLATQLL